VALVNATGSPLAQASEIVLPLSAGVEQSVAATKNLCRQPCRVAPADRRLGRGGCAGPCGGAAAKRLEAASTLDWSFLVWGRRRLRRISSRRGAGRRFESRAEAALKLKETCAIHAEAYSGRGAASCPIALVTKGFRF